MGKMLGVYKESSTSMQMCCPVVQVDYNKVALSHSSSVTFESDGVETAENVVVTIGATANKMAIVTQARETANTILLSCFV